MRFPFVVAIQCIAVVVLAIGAPPAMADTDPIKVFILGGQSNMVGYGRIDDSATNTNGESGTLREMVKNNLGTWGHGGTNPLVGPDQSLAGDGDYLTRSDVSIYTKMEGVYGDPDRPGVIRYGGLTTGYGRHNNEIGPEYGFGWSLGNAIDGDVLIIKVATGGTTLGGDWRSPTAVDNRGGDVGNMWLRMTETVDDVLDNLGTYFPGYTGRDVEIAGFGWHQGYNDIFDTDFNAEYEDNLVDLITSVRSEYGDADLPFVVGTTSMRPQENAENKIEQAQKRVGDPSLYPEYVGNVEVIDTNPFWRDSDISPSNFGHHWNHNGQSYFDIGTSMGDAMVTLVPEPSSMMLMGGVMLFAMRRPKLR